MTAGTDALKQAWRFFRTDGIPATGVHEPEKAEIHAALDSLGLDIVAAGSGGDPSAVRSVIEPIRDEALEARDDALVAAAQAEGAAVPFRATLSDWVLQTPFLTEEGYYFSSTGVRTAASNYRYAIYNVPAGQLGMRASGRPLNQALAVYKNAVNGPSGSASTLGYEFLNTSTTFVDQVLTLPNGTLSIVINSRTDTAVSLSAKVIAPTVAERTTAVEKAALKNTASVAAILAAVSTWQSAGAALVQANGSLYTQTGTISANASFNRGLYVINGAESGFRFTGRLTTSDSAAQIVYFANADGTGFISYEPVPGNDLNGYVMTVPATARSIGFTSRGTTPMVLEVLKPTDLSNVGATYWRGKTWGALGDSITNQGVTVWMPLVTSALGIAVTNFGISGTKISGAHDDPNAMCGDTRINAMPTTFDLITIMGGTNDWAQDTPLGDINGSVYRATFANAIMTVTAFTSGPAIKVGDTISGAGIVPGTKITSVGTGTGGVGTYNISTDPGTLTGRRVNSFDPTTFYGALNTFADKAFARWPLKRIVLVTTPYGERGVNPGWSSEAYNALGLNTNDYADAIRKVADRRNLAVFDVARNGGWGTTNIVAAMNNGTDKLHPAAGSRAAAGIATVFRNGMRAIEPVS